MSLPKSSMPFFKSPRSPWWPFIFPLPPIRLPLSCTVFFKSISPNHSDTHTTAFGVLNEQSRQLPSPVQQPLPIFRSPLRHPPSPSSRLKILLHDHTLITNLLNDPRPFSNDLRYTIPITSHLQSEFSTGAAASFVTRVHRDGNRGTRASAA